MAEGKGRPEWQAAQRRQKLVGFVKAFLWAIIVGVAVGVGVVYKKQIIAAWNSLTGSNQTQQVATNKPASQPLPPVTPKVVEKPVDVAPPPALKKEPPVDKSPAIAKAAEVVPGGEEAIVEKLLKEGRAQLEKFEFTKAREMFAAAGQKKGGPKLREECRDWLKKAEQFELAIRHIPITEYASAETSYIIKTHDGWERTGLIVSRDEQKIRLQEIWKENPASTGKKTLPIPRNEIAGMIEVSKEQRRAEFVKILAGVESSVNVQRSTDYYDMVYLARRLALGRECIEYLNRAFHGGPGHEPDPYLGDSFRKEVIRRTIDRASLMLASGRSKTLVESELKKLVKEILPGYAVAADEVEAFRIQVMSKVADNFKSTLKEVKRSAPAVASNDNSKPPSKPAPTARELVREETELVEIVVDNSGVAGNGAAAPLVDKANQKYDEGMKLYRGFKLGTNGNNNQALRSALALLSEAVDLYGEALDKDPGNKAVLDRQTEANMIVYACRKYQTL